MHNTHSFVLRETDRDEIICACCALQSKLSSGFDCIFTKLLLRVIDLLIYHWSIFSLSYWSGVYSDLFKIAKVVPIYKGGEHLNLVIYKPVSVLPPVSKMEQLMYNRMFTYIDNETYSLLTKWQSGFRPRRSTQAAIANFVD